jgi:phospholipid/cholesterol/gamma-HCH transport system permease protein
VSKQDRSGLQEGLKHLLELAEVVPEKKGARGASDRPSFLTRVGNTSMGYGGLCVGEVLLFLGELFVALARFVRGKARYRRVDMLEAIQQCGAEAVGIVSLIAFLIDVILAFMAAAQLPLFGASIYVADLVGTGMVRDMGAMMTAIMISGHTGTAFAAKLGTMKVTQEIDALMTLRISPLQFLVLPRVLTLIVMMPLLCLFADLLGGGLLKATTYGVLIAIAGCLRGFQWGNSSSAVGDAATNKDLHASETIASSPAAGRGESAASALSEGLATLSRAIASRISALNERYGAAF